MDVTKAVEEIKAGKVEYHAKNPVSSIAGIGKVSFDEAKLVNFNTLYDAVEKSETCICQRYLLQISGSVFNDGSWYQSGPERSQKLRSNCILTTASVLCIVAVVF